MCLCVKFIEILPPGSFGLCDAELGFSGISPLIHCSVLLLFSVLSFFSSLFPSILGIFWKGDSLA